LLPHLALCAENLGLCLVVKLWGADQEHDDDQIIPLVPEAATTLHLHEDGEEDHLSGDAEIDVGPVVPGKEALEDYDKHDGVNTDRKHVENLPEHAT